MRFLFIFLILNAFNVKSQVTSWDVTYSIENINAEASVIEALSSMISMQQTKINYYFYDNNLVNIASYDSLNEIRTVMLKDESHTYVFVTLDGITTYKKKPIAGLEINKNNKPLTKEETPIVKFIENKVVGPFNCTVNEVILPNMNFKLISTTTNDIKASNGFNNPIPMPEIENSGLALALEADFGFAKIHLQHGNFKTVPYLKSIFSISIEGLKETNMEEMKFIKLITGFENPSEMEEEK